MRGLALIIFCVAVSCNAQSPQILAPIGWNRGMIGQPWYNSQPWTNQGYNPQQQWYGQQQQPWYNQPWTNPSYGQQQPWTNQPWTNPGYSQQQQSYYYPYNPQNQWPAQNGQQPWNNNGNRQSPQNQNSPACFDESQQCFSQMPEYWSAFQSIDSNPTLTKGEISDNKKTLVQRLSPDVQRCYKDAENKQQQCIKQQRRNLVLTSAARNAFNKIKKIHDNKKITRQQECHDISQFLQTLNSQVVNELFTKIPGLRVQMQSNTNGQMQYNPNTQYSPYNQMPFASYNQMQYSPNGQNQYAPYNQMQYAPYNQFNPNQRK